MQLDATINSHYMKIISENGKVSPCLMPLFHVCTSHAFRSIFHNLKLEPMPCKVFKEALIYFFYGKPAYRINDANKSRDASMYPICWGLDANSIQNIVRVYPFDSGSFKDMISKKIATHFELDHFKLDNNFETIQKFIHYFYETNDNYFLGTPSLKNAAIPAQSYELQTILHLAEDRSADIDDRVNTIEIQTDTPINIKVNDIKILGIPAPLLNDPNVAEFIAENEIDFFTYDLHKFSPQTINYEFYSRTKKHYVEKGIIGNE